MTFSNAQSLRARRRPAIIRACGLGLALALAVPALAANAANPAVQGAVAKPKVSQIDFKRGDGGAGRLILRFDGEGAAPDLRNRDGSVVVDVSNAILPAELQRPLNVTDFATPVQRIEAKPHGGGAQLVLSTRGAYESLAYQTGNEYVVEVSPRAAAAVGATGSGATGVNARIAKQGYSGKPVTFNFQDVPVRTVLQLIAEESNLNIVASDTVAGNVTLRLDNVPWDQAMDIVLRAKGLDKRKDGNVIWVAPQPELAAFEKAKEDARIDLENRVDLVTDYIQINYHSAAAIFKSLTEAKGIGNSGQGGGGGGGDNQENGFLSQRGRIVADERTNTLMISDIPKKVAQMRELINVIDRPVDQVLIESRIVIATDTFARDLGARFGVQGRDLGNNTRVISGSLDNNATIINEGKYNIPGGLNFNLPAVTTNGANVGAIAYTLLGANFAIDVELSALQQEGRGEVLSNPRVVTSNQREAIIRQGRQVGYVTLTGGGNQAFPTPTVEFKDVVLELKVTPTITSDDRVFMAVHVTKDEVLRFIDTSIGQVPEIATREINTAVLVDDGQTVVIGGVYEFTDANSVAKVPFLGDVPFLGNLFKKKSRSKDKAELLIFLTPKVMRVEKRT
ncbi:MAG: type IV pilus secretin PilQ family protein [Xanthomonadales bacterium]|nr:type IV pilus secretin PilQ family protein [Xanthomonadaceae bacterium]MBN8225302.1 type IV pilus secretin PilQ family protein [Xanthomonadales bacterium]MCA0196805.1 type IV pilus secretin PilQ family protein [Pseudomonadota bacterium]